MQAVGKLQLAAELNRKVTERLLMPRMKHAAKCANEISIWMKSRFFLFFVFALSIGKTPRWANYDLFWNWCCAQPLNFSLICINNSSTVTRVYRLNCIYLRLISYPFWCSSLKEFTNFVLFFSFFFWMLLKVCNGIMIQIDLLITEKCYVYCW